VAGQRGRRVHVDRVDVRTFLAVDLDADVVLVHECGHGGVLERVVGHDVAPVAGGVAHAEQDGHVAPPRLGQRVVAPRPPLDRVFGVLAQVRARRSGQAVAHFVDPA
jgi:hypothetical protein